MATETQEVLIKVQMDAGEALKRQQQLKVALDAAKNSLLELEKAEGKTSKAYIAQEAQVASLNQQLRNNGTVLKQLSQNTGDAAGAYALLNQKSAEANQKAKDLAAAYGANDERTKAATKNALGYTNQLKEIDKAVGQNFRSVGDYGKATEGLAGAFGQMPGALGKMGGAVSTATTGFQAMNMASPVGWITIAIQVIAGLVQKFSTFAPVADAITNSMAKLTAAFDVLKNGVIALVTGQKSLGEVMSGATDEMTKQIAEAERLAEAQRDLEDRTEASSVSQEKYKNQINQLLLQSKNRTLSEKERMRLIDEALVLEGKAYAERKKLADDEVKLIQDKLIKQGGLNAFEASELRKKGVAYARYKEDQKNLEDQTIKDLAAALVTQQQIEGESISLREKAMNRRDVIADKEAENAEKREAKAQAAREKQNEAQKKIEADNIARSEVYNKKQDELYAAQQKALEGLTATIEAVQEVEDLDTTALTQYVKDLEDAKAYVKGESYATQLDAEQAFLDEQYARQIANAQKVGADTNTIQQAYAIASKEIEKKKTDANLSLASQFAGNIATIFGKNTKVGKAAASAQIAIDTYKGAMAAFSSMQSIPIVGPALGVAAAAAVAVQGAKAIKDVWATKSGLPGDAGGGGASVSGAVPTATASVTGSLVSRTSGQTAQQAQTTAVSTALQQNPTVPVLVIDDVTSSQANKVQVKQTNSL